MSVTSWLWNELHDLFGTDDGSLPEVRINYSDPEATSAGYALLRTRARMVSPENQLFCSITEDTAQPLDSVPNAAALVVTGEADPFHVVFGGIECNGVTIPDLGVFVFQDQLALDYRMGAAWGPAELQAFFQLLCELIAFDPKATIALEESVLPEVVARFRNALRRYRGEHTA
jgi:hypothetical protein